LSDITPPVGARSIANSMYVWLFATDRKRAAHYACRYLNYSRVILKFSLRSGGAVGPKADFLKPNFRIQTPAAAYPLRDFY